MSFAERHPDAYASMALAMKEYAKYITEYSTNQAAAAAAAAPRAHAKLALEHDDDGFPILPDVIQVDGEHNLEHSKRLIRSYLTDHYRVYVCSR